MMRPAHERSPNPRRRARQGPRPDTDVRGQLYPLLELCRSCHKLHGNGQIAELSYPLFRSDQDRFACASDKPKLSLRLTGESSCEFQNLSFLSSRLARCVAPVLRLPPTCRWAATPLRIAAF